MTKRRLRFLLHTSVLLAVLAPLLLVLTTGCSATYWAGKTEMHTAVTLDVPKRTIEIYNSKDTSLEVEDLKWSENEGFSLGHLSMTDIASTPITAEVERIRAVAEAQLTQAQYLSNMGGVISSVVTAVGEMAVKLGVDFSPPGLLDADVLKAALNAYAAAQTPTTQPATDGP